MRRLTVIAFLAALAGLMTGRAAFAAITTSAMSMPAGMEEEKPLGFSIDSSISRGFIEYEDVVDLELNGNVGYRFNKSHSVAGTISHRGAIYREETGSSLSTPIAHTERYGFTNLRFMHTMPEIITRTWSKLSWRNTLILPTSAVARDASLNGALATQLDWDLIVHDRLTITPEIGVIARSYRYDTANVNGSEMNSPFGYFVGSTISVEVLNNLIANAGYTIWSNQDFDKVWTMSQKAQASLQYSISRTFMVHADYGWKDKVLTNDEAFAAGKSSFGGGFSVSY